MKIADFFAEVSFKWDSLKLKELVGLVGNLNASSIAGVAGLGKLGEVVDDIIKSTDSLTANIQAIHAATGIDQNFLYQLEELSEQFMATKADADAFVQSLSKASVDISRGQNPEAQLAYQLMGVNSQASLENQIAQIMKFVSNPEKFNSLLGKIAPDAHSQEEKMAQFRAQIMAPLGISPQMINTLLNGDKLSSMPILNPGVFVQQAKAHQEYFQALQNTNSQMANIVIELTTFGAHILEFINKFKVINTLFDFMFKGGVFGLEPIRNFHSSVQNKVQGGIHTLMSNATTPHLGGASGNWTTSRDNNSKNEYHFTVYAQDVNDFVHKANQAIMKKINFDDKGVGGYTK